MGLDRKKSKAGKLGAKARMMKLSPEQRVEIGRRAIAARWAKREAQRTSEQLQRLAGDLEALRHPNPKLRSLLFVPIVKDLRPVILNNLRPGSEAWSRAGVKMTDLLTRALETGDGGAVDELLAMAKAGLSRVVITLAEMLDELESTDPVRRLEVLPLLAQSIGAGMRLSGMSELDAEHGAGKDVSDLLSKAVIEGRGPSTVKLRSILTNDPGKAASTPQEAPARGPIEPSAETRLLASQHSCLDLLDALARPGMGREARRRRVEALMVRAGEDGAGRVNEAAVRAFVGLAKGLILAEGPAIDAARRWVVEHLLSARKEVES